MSKSESDENSSGDEDFEAHAHLFRSSLDVGSHFIDIVPDNELVFYNNQGTLYTQMTIKNVTNKAHVAYFVIIDILISLGVHVSPLPDQDPSQERFHPSHVPADHQDWLGSPRCPRNLTILTPPFRMLINLPMLCSS